MRYLFEEYAFDTDRRELHRGADVVSVAPQVFDLLDYLIRNRERVVSKDDLINAIWNGRIVSDAALTTRLNAARTAIGDSGEEQRLIKTLPRKGFRFVGPVREAEGREGWIWRSCRVVGGRRIAASPLGTQYRRERLYGIEHTWLRNGSLHWRFRYCKGDGGPCGRLKP